MERDAVAVAAVACADAVSAWAMAEQRAERSRVIADSFWARIQARRKEQPDANLDVAMRKYDARQRRAQDHARQRREAKGELTRALRAYRRAVREARRGA